MADPSPPLAHYSGGVVVPLLRPSPASLRGYPRPCPPPPPPQRCLPSLQPGLLPPDHQHRPTLLRSSTQLTTPARCALSPSTPWQPLLSPRSLPPPPLPAMGPPPAVHGTLPPQLTPSCWTRVPVLEHWGCRIPCGFRRTHPPRPGG